MNSAKRDRGRTRLNLRKEGGDAAPGGSAPQDSQRLKSAEASTAPQLVAGAAVLVVGVWAYWPTLVEMVRAWEREPDYSHGYLVAPMALLFLWMNRKAMPKITPGSWVASSLLLTASFGIRLFASVYYVDAIDGWSMLFWMAGCVALLFGTDILRWSWTSIAFLFFMVPLPFRVEGVLSLPLQQLATNVSSWTLQLLGQPAIVEGNTILLGDNRLEVEQACSGLRLFMSIMALAFAYLILVKRAWWEKVSLLVCAIPIAIIANSARIVATGLLYQYASSDAARHFAHDFAGWAMIPFAASLFWFVLWYMSRLIENQEQVELISLARRVEL